MMMKQEDRSLNDTALQIQRYDLGLMTPEEKAAFERALSKSRDLQKEFHNAGEALASVYIRLSQGMPAPEKELKDILLAKINEKKPERAGILAGSTLGTSVVMIPTAISDTRPLAAGGELKSGISSGIKKIIAPLFFVAAVSLFLIGMSNVVSNENSNVPISSFVQNHQEGVVDMSRKFYDLPQVAGRSKRSSKLLTNHNNTESALRLPKVDNERENLPVSEISPVETSFPVITVNPISSKQDQIAANPFNHNMIPIGNDELSSETNWGERISFSIRRISTLKFYPGRLDMAPVPSMNNWGAALKYEISPVVAIGIEAGRETFPFYREKSNDMYDEFYSITWEGASVTVSAPSVEIFNCHPEARAVAGFSTAGPMGKISAGFIWQPSHIISFSPELEYTGVYIKNTGIFIEGQDDVSNGGKLGFTASMAVHF